MKPQEHEAYPNPFHVLMHARDRRGALNREGLDVTDAEIFDHRAGTAGQGSSLEQWQQPVENALLGAVSAYYQRFISGPGKTRHSDNEGDAQGFMAVVLQLRRLNSLLAERPYVGGKQFSGADKTAICALNFVSSLNIKLPIDCLALRRWYASVSEAASPVYRGGYEA